jgi:GTP cyclohydrolase I
VNRALHVARGPARLDRTRVEQAARELLVALGADLTDLADLTDESLRDTPRRMAAAYRELLTPEPFDATTAEHTCMSLRGAAKPGTRTVTSALHGLVRDDPRTRQEFLALTGRTTHG